LPTTNGAGTLLYPLTDHLGSTVGLLDTTGAVVSTQKYWPYGATRTATGTLPTDKQYTGQQIEPGDSALGLYNYKARFYSTVLGRFVSADALTKDTLNRYTYVLNNPLSFVDPSGRCFNGVDGKQVTDTCTEDDVKAWIECAFTCTDPDLKLMATVGMGEKVFWDNALKIWNQKLTQNRNYEFAAGLVVTIMKYAVESPSTFDAIGYYGFGKLGFMVGLGEHRGDFFRASLHDLIFGTQWILSGNQVSDRSMIGAGAWWKYLGIELTKQGAPDWAKNNSSLATLSYIDRTLTVAMTLYQEGRDVNGFGWSPEQWTLLSGHVPGVHVPAAASSCVDDPQCLAEWWRLANP
jgi:RHS repeat-associated protein